MYEIGLFPLNIIVFPSTYFPLHIFENRYKRLINDALEYNKTFGINYLSDSKMFEIGTQVRIEEVTKKYDDGKMDIIVKGEERFVLEQVFDGRKPYFIGKVEKYSDIGNEIIDKELFYEVSGFYDKVLDIAFGVKDNLSQRTLSFEFNSFIIASKVGLEFSQKQILLEMRSENERLEYLRRHLERVVPQLNNVMTIKNIIASDGYLTPDSFNL